MIKKLVEFGRNHGKKFTTQLLKFETVDRDLLRYFYDIAMPSISTYTYSSRVLFNRFSKVVTPSEEAFGYLVFENSFDRWIYQAEKMRPGAGSGNGSQDIDENEDDTTSIANRDEVPNVLYQKYVKRRKDNVLTAGKWTDEGLERYNELIGLVKEARKGRENFEDELKEDYVLHEPTEEYISKVEKRRRENKNIGGDTNNPPNKKVRVVNVLNVEEL